MRRSKRLYVAAGLVAVIVVAGIGGGMAIAASGDDNQPITGSALDKASAAALAHTGGGTVTETEAGDEEGYYQVEVKLDDGSQVDVNLDENFNVIAQSADDDNQGDHERSSGD